MNWPCKKNLGADKFTPSPYEIFDMHRSSVYSKQKFYELVKIYHPDRSNHVTDCEITQYERLERVSLHISALTLANKLKYRLVVLAHEILSDPHKRSAYDAYGAGWGAKQRPVPAQHSRGFSSSTGKYYGRGAEYDSTPFSNATWEDWERWYRRDAPQSARQQYTGTYLNPNAFAALVVALAVVSGVVSATRAGQYSASLGEKQLAFTEETNRFMTERANNLVDNRLDKNARVKHFLEKRDPTRYGLKEEEEIEYRRHFGGTNGLPPDRSVTGTKLASKKPTQTDND